MNLRSIIAGFASLPGALSLIGAAFFSPAAFADLPNSLTSYFDNSGFNSTLDTENIVGTGLMTYEGTPLADGAYDYTSFSGLTFSFTFDGDIAFNAADLLTNPGEVGLKIVIAGTTFQFSAPANGFSNGSAEFVNGTGDYFTFSPEAYPTFAYYVVTGGTEGGGYFDGTTLYQGTYGIGGIPSSSDIADPEGTYVSSGLGATVNPAFTGGTLTVDEADASYAQDFTVASGAIDTAGNTVTFTGVFSDADIDNPGSLSIINSVGGGSLTLTGDSTFSGLLTVDSDAAVILTGSLTSDVTINASGSFAQNGTVTGNIINNGLLSGSGQINGNVENFGTFGPGNSPGVTVIAGDYTENGTLEIEIGGTDGPGVDPTGHDQVQVSGTTTLNPGSTLTLIKFTAYEPARGDQFTLIDSAGGISGNFSTLDRTSFDTQLYFDPRTGIVYGSGLAEGESFAAFEPDNRNASAIAAALYGAGLTTDSNGTYLAFVDSDTAMGSAVIALLTGASTLDTLNALSPEPYAGLADYGLHVTRNYASQAASAPFVSVTDGWRVSASYAGYSNGSDSSLNDADYDLRSNGAVIGVSHAVGGGVSLGAFVAGDDARVSASRLDAEGDGYAVGVFAVYLPTPDSDLSFDANAGYGEYSFDADRQTLSGLATANEIDSKAYTVGLNARYVLVKFDRAQISGLVGTNYTHVKVDGITETGPEAVITEEMTEEMLSGQAGFEVRAAITPRLGVNAHAVYEHNFSETKRNVVAAFAEGGPSFTVRAPGLDEDTINLGVGASLLVTDRLTLGAYYNAGFAEDTELASSFGARLGYRF